jgi:hypothetical protein
MKRAVGVQELGEITPVRITQLSPESITDMAWLWRPQELS